jgi:hypothetical protein
MGRERGKKFCLDFSDCEGNCKEINLKCEVNVCERERERERGEEHKQREESVSHWHTGVTV